MVDAQGALHLIDFGEARQMEQGLTSLSVDLSQEYRPFDLMAPEMLRQTDPEEGPAAEVFTHGLVGAMLLTGKDTTAFASEIVHTIWPALYQEAPRRADGNLDPVALRAQLAAAGGGDSREAVARQSVLNFIEAVYARSPKQGPFIITRMLHPDPQRRPTMAEVAKEMQPSHAEQASAAALFSTRLGSDEDRSKVARALDLEQAGLS